MNSLANSASIGLSNVNTERVLPAAVLHELFGTPREDDAPSAWDMLRTLGDPPQLLMSIERIEISGREYLATCGLGYCDLPDLAWEHVDDDATDDVIEMFNDCFAYMMEHEIAFQAGETIKDENDRTYRFSDDGVGWAHRYALSRSRPSWHA